jgi:hypothetical protein
LTQHVYHPVLDQRWIAWVSDAACRCIHQAELSVHLTEQHDSAIAGHAAAVKSAFYNTPANSAKFNLL